MKPVKCICADCGGSFSTFGGVEPECPECNKPFYGKAIVGMLNEIPGPVAEEFANSMGSRYREIWE